MVCLTYQKNKKENLQVIWQWKLYSVSFYFLSRGGRGWVKRNFHLCSLSWIKLMILIMLDGIWKLKEGIAVETTCGTMNLGEAMIDLNRSDFVTKRNKPFCVIYLGFSWSVAKAVPCDQLLIQRRNHPFNCKHNPFHSWCWLSCWKGEMLIYQIEVLEWHLKLLHSR